MNGERKNHGKERTGGRNLPRTYEFGDAPRQSNRLSGHFLRPPSPFGYYCRYVTYHSNLTLPAALAIPRVPPRLDPTTTGRVACQNSSAPNIATFL